MLDFNQKCNVYYTDHSINQQVSSVLARGFNARVLPARVKVDGNTIVYGILRGTGNLLKQCEQEKTPYLYCDHSFFNKTRKQFFRLIQNHRYFNYLVDAPSDRFEQLNIPIKPWRKTGNHIVIAPLSRYVGEFIGIKPGKWLEHTISNLSKFTDRDIVIKEKDSEEPLSESLKDAWALVTLDSMSAVDAAIQGVPVITSYDNAAAQIASFGLNEIEDLPTPDRMQWLSNLAYLQYTGKEIEDGVAKANLQEMNEVGKTLP